MKLLFAIKGYCYKISANSILINESEVRLYSKERVRRYRILSIRLTFNL